MLQESRYWNILGFFEMGVSLRASLRKTGYPQLPYLPEQ
jgi:hypothetical protein